jgi:hypothetical protein
MPGKPELCGFFNIQLIRNIHVVVTIFITSKCSSYYMDDFKSSTFD